MSEPTDKVRVIRLIKKPQAPKPTAPPPSPPAAGAEEASAHQPRRQARGERPMGERRWKKKPLRKRRAPRRPAPPRPKPKPVVLTEEQRNRVLELYRGMVVAGERPAEGRRKKIAAMLNIPYANVAEVVRAHITHARYRQTNFDIEKAYWQAVRGGETDARVIARQISQKIGFDEGRVWWWLEKLHEPRKAFAKDPEVEEGKRAAILAAYEAYLQQPDPPTEGLHKSFAEQIGGVTPRQVHKVLWEYRMKVWTSLAGTVRPPAPEPAAEELAAEEPAE